MTLSTEHAYAEILCRANNLREQDRAGLAPGVSDHSLFLAQLDLERAERRLRMAGLGHLIVERAPGADKL